MPNSQESVHNVDVLSLDILGTFFRKLSKYTTPSVGTFVLDGRTPLNANALLIFLIILLILLNYIAVKMDKIDKQ